MNKLIADNFMWELELEVLDKKLDTLVNSLLNINFNSDNFIASTTMDIDVKMFNKFAQELLQVYKSLSGSTILKETYGNNFIEFKAMNNGYIHVKGLLNYINRNGFLQELKFANEFDQTYLENFVKEINKKL